MWHLRVTMKKMILYLANCVQIVCIQMRFLNIEKLHLFFMVNFSSNDDKRPKCYQKWLGTKCLCLSYCSCLHLPMNFYQLFIKTFTISGFHEIFGVCQGPSDYQQYFRVTGLSTYDRNEAKIGTHLFIYWTNFSYISFPSAISKSGNNKYKFNVPL